MMVEEIVINKKRIYIEELKMQNITIDIPEKPGPFITLEVTLGDTEYCIEGLILDVKTRKKEEHKKGA